MVTAETVAAFGELPAPTTIWTVEGSLLFRFEGSLRSGLGGTRRTQIGMHVRF